MTLSFRDYYQQFIWERNYIEAPKILTGDVVISRGNTVMDLENLFPNAQIIEYYFPESNQEFE